MSLTITPSPFGSLVVSVAETNSTLSVSTVATSPCVLSMALGVPGPQGETGSQGPAGANGVGVPTGGSAGQVLAKIDGTNYNTEWVNAATGDFLPLSGGTMTGTIYSIGQDGIPVLSADIWDSYPDGSRIAQTQIGSDGTYGYIKLNGEANGTIGFYGNSDGTFLQFPDFSTQATAGLPLTGGTISVGALVDFATTSGNDSEIGAWGFGVENTSGQVSYIEPQEIRIYDGTSTTGTRLIASGVQFNDSTTQTTAGLPLTGGTVTGDVSLYNPSGSPVEMLFINGDGFSIINHDTNQTLSLSYSGITYPDSSIQTTAFPPTGGTTSQYIDGTGALQTFPTVTTAGKMVTSFRNNTGATLAKGTVVYINGQVGNKPTVAKAQANTEATSKATYGFVETAVANNTDGNIVILGLLENIDTQGFSDGDLLYLSPTTAGAFTKTQPFSPYHYVRVGTVIRGGHPTQGSIAVQVTNGFQLDEMSDVGATAPSNANVLTWDSTASQWLDKSISTILGYTPLSSTTASATYQTISGMSAYLSTASASATYQTQSGMSAYLSTASAVANYQTISGMSAYLSTSAAASTYQTQSAMSAYLSTASASANYISTSAYATTAQAQAGTSASTVISPSTFFDARWFAGSKSMVQIAWSTSVSGTGASAGTQNANARLNIAPTTATGYAIASAVIANNSRGTIFNNGFDFSKRVSFGLRVARNVASPDTNSVWRFSIGKSSVTDASDLSARGLMVKVSGGGALQLLVHNGTTLTTTTSSYTPANGVSYDLIVTSDGAGNVTLYVNGSSVATSTGGPTSAGSANANVMMFEVQNTATISGSPQSICISDYFVQVNS